MGVPTAIINELEHLQTVFLRKTGSADGKQLQVR
jgi:hypothetical protein